MSAYTKVNFMDKAADSKKNPVEMRFTRGMIESKDLGMTHVIYEPNFKNPKGHTHETQEEVYAVISGSGRALLDDKVEDLRQWDVLRVAPETLRAFEAGPDGLEMIVAGGPAPLDGDGKLTDAAWPN